MDTRLYTIMEWLFRLVYVNFLWLLFSIAIITALPSFYAMIAVINEWKDDKEDFTVWSKFLMEFKRNFWKSYRNSVIHLLIIGVLLIDFLILRNNGNENVILVSYALLTLAILYITITFYAVPLSVKFSLKYYKTIILALILLMKQPVRSLLMILIPVLSAILLLVQTGFGILFFGSFVAFYMVISTNTGLRKIYGHHHLVEHTVQSS